jgi:O-antigen/teichoic acid export membrane protein
MSIKRQTLWSIVPLLVVTAINIFSVPLFYRFLGPVLYALWFYVITFTGTFGFMDLGLGVAVGRYVGIALGKKDTQAVREYWGTGNVIAIPLLAVMGVVFTLIGVLFGPKWFNVDPSLVRLLQWSFVAGGLGLFLSYYAQFWLILSQAHLDFKFISILRTATSLLQIVPSIALAWATRNPLILILWGIAVGTLQLAIYVWHAKKSYSLTFSFGHAGRQRAREMAAYTAKTFASLIVGALTGTLDRLVLGKLAPPATFTNYAISSNAGTRILGLGGAVMGPVFHNTSRAVGSGSREALAQVYDEIFDFTFPWYALVSISIFVWHPVLLRLWLGADLGAQISPIFVPMVVACCLTAISNISTAQLGPLNRLGTGLIFAAGAGILLAIGVYYGWRWYGVVGVAWGFLFSRIVLFVQDLYVIRLVHAGGWLAARTWKHLVFQVVVGCVFFSTAFLLPRTSFWQLIPAFFHGSFMMAWLLRKPARNFLKGMRPSAATPEAV